MSPRPDGSPARPPTWRFLLRGAVQGSGVRPRIARLAAERGWRGLVRNVAGGVEVLVALSDGDDPGRAADALRVAAGPEARIDVTPAGGELPPGFVIEPSDTHGPPATTVPRDSATCADCLAEVRDPADRRHGYPFTACAGCGPRYSVVTAMPYDRVRTTLDAFPLCDECRREYADPRDRRFHAQATVCPACGPRVWCVDRSGRLVAGPAEAIGAAAAALRDGRIVALRGVGGYQLLCDASSPAAVAELRRRKRRPLKPLAVLCRSVEAAERLAVVGPAERAALTSPANPIVLLRRRPDAPLADAVAPGVGTVGVLLPTSPLHHLLADAAGRPLVCTSGNREGEPLEIDPAGAERTLAGVADLFLHHDREIRQPIDDSVVRVVAGRRVTFRCARGLAPLPLRLGPARPVVALGGHQKGAVAVSNGAQAVLGPHVGDLDTEPARGRWVDRLDALARLYGVDAAEYVRDAHPDYFPTRFAAERLAPGRAVWHHHAHVAAGMADHGLLDRAVLGVAFDGTGLGPDGTIWGGEFLLVRGGRFRRLGHLRPFALVGGEAAVRDVRRLAVALLAQLPEVSPTDAAALLGVSRRDVDHWQRLCGSPRTPRTSSCGRLFDAAAALTLGLGETVYDGQAAMTLEAACDPAATGEYRFELGPSEPWELDWRPVLRAVVRDVGRGEPAGAVATRFHRALATAVVAAGRRRPELPVVLGGGVFQNRMLVEEIVSRWPPGSPPPVWPCEVPPNDGGLATGQLAIALLSEPRKE